jgi:hypothetical protein
MVVVRLRDHFTATRAYCTFFKDHFRRAHREFRESTDIALDDSELARDNANLVQQVVTGVQAAMAAESNPDDTTDMLLRASEAKMHEMQEPMNLLQAQVANQRPAPCHPCNSYPTQSYPLPSNGGYHQGSQGHQQQNPNYQGQHYNPNYQQGQQRQQPNQDYQGGYQGRGTQGRGFQGRGRSGNDG